MRKLLVIGTVLVLGACSSMSQMPTLPKLSTLGSASAPVSSTKESSNAAIVTPPKQASAREYVAYAIQLLDAGRVQDGKAALNTALAKSPKDATALLLLEQIDGDPIALLGEESEPYVAAAGDTMSELAARYLGDPMLFVALSRYNDLTAPNTLAVGRTLRIPTRNSKAAIAAAPVASANTSPATVSPNASKANAARLQALELLNAGDVEGAVSLLNDAHALDQTNSAIRKDLERARRIQSALTDG